MLTQCQVIRQSLGPDCSSGWVAHLSLYLVWFLLLWLVFPPSSWLGKHNPTPPLSQWHHSCTVGSHQKIGINSTFPLTNLTYNIWVRTSLMGSLKRTLNFKIKRAMTITALSPSRIPPAQLPFCVTVLACIEGIYKKHAREPCYATYTEVLLRMGILRAVYSRAKISLSWWARGLIHVRKTEAQHVFYNFLFLMFLCFPLISLHFTFILWHIIFINMYISFKISFWGTSLLWINNSTIKINETERDNEKFRYHERKNEGHDFQNYKW